MKANKKSLHAKLYRFTYTGDLPENLCPYFWRLVFGFLVLIPNFVIQFPSLIKGKIKTSWKEPNCYWNRRCGAEIWLSLVPITIYLVSTWNLIKAAFNTYYYDYELANVGLAINSIILLIALAFILCVLVEEGKLDFILNRNKEKSEAKPNIIVEFIKAKYNRYCPKIDWD